MSKARWVVAAAATGLAVLAAAVYLTSLGKNDGFIDPSADEGRITLGKTVYAANCAACHGVNLEGQANWREWLANGRLPAPPHDKTGHTQCQCPHVGAAVVERLPASDEKGAGLPTERQEWIEQAPPMIALASITSSVDGRTWQGR